MLSREALESALPLADTLDRVRLYVTAAPGTPLEALVRETRASDVALATPISGTGGAEVDIGTIEYLANCKDPVLDVCKHDLAMDDVVETCVKAVQGHILFAKTTVAAAVQELVEKTLEVMNSLQPASLLGMEVCVCNPPAPLLNSAFETSVRRFEDVPFDSPDLRMKLPAKTAKEIIELMMTGTSGLDDAISAWAAEKGDVFILELWENLFQQKQAELHETVSKRFVDYVSDRETGTDYALGIYLLARRLVDDPIEGIEMPLPLFEKTVVEFRNQAGLRLCRALDEQDEIQRGEMLVKRVEGNKTSVNGSVYRKWIEAGGENEVLFGNAMTAPHLYTVEAINAAAGQLKSDWGRQAALAATVEANRRFERLKETLSRVFRQQLFAITEGEEATEGNRQTVLRLFEEQLNLVREGDTKDLYDLCLKLVCRSRFYKTDAERILGGIEKVKRENPAMDIREAAAVSVIEYIAEWVASQLKIEAV